MKKHRTGFDFFFIMLFVALTTLILGFFFMAYVMGKGVPNNWLQWVDRHILELAVVDFVLFIIVLGRLGISLDSSTGSGSSTYRKTDNDKESSEDSLSENSESISEPWYEASGEYAEWLMDRYGITESSYMALSSSQKWELYRRYKNHY